MKIIRDIFIIILLLSLQATTHAEDIVLENNNIIVVFNSENGTIEKLISKITGWKIEKRSDLARSFSMNVPLPNQRFNPVVGTDQILSHWRVDEESQKVTFTCDKLSGVNSGELDISFKNIIKLTERGLIFTCEIDNRSNYVIESIRWPVLGDLSIPNKLKSFSQKGLDYGGMAQFEIFPKFENEPGYFAVDNPSNWMEYPTTPFILLGNEDEGLYVGYHDTSVAELVQFKTELKPGYVSYELWDTGINPTTDSIAGQPVRYEFSAIHFPYINPNETVKLEPIVIQPYKGDWHKGADIYKSWRATWFKAPSIPTWLNNVNSWQQIHMNNPEDDIRYKYSDLIEIGKDCAENGVKAIQVTGWTKGGQDRDNPSHDIDPRLGNWEDLKNAIAEVKKLGVKIILFTKFTWADRSTDWYKNELYKFASKDPYGDAHYYNGYAYQTDVQLAEINTHHFSPMCHLSTEWRTIADKEFEKTLLLEADGMLFDENQHHGGAKYCFDKSHGHHIPAFIFAGDEKLAKGFGKIKKEINPNYIFAGEGNYDLEFRQYNLSYFRVDLDHVPMHRYVAPDEEMMIAVSGYNDRNIINTALLYRYIISYEPRNFKGRLNEFPMTLAYGKKVDSLRKKYKRFLWNGKFQHTVGAEIIVDGEKYDKYSVYLEKATNKRAVVIANYDNNRSIEVNVQFQGQHSKLYRVTPEEPSKITSNGDEIVTPNSVIVIFEN